MGITGQDQLTGVNPDPNYTSTGAKVPGVVGGTLDVQGEGRAGWARLNTTAQKGSRTLTLENASTGWHQGDRIAIPCTDYDPAQALTFVNAKKFYMSNPVHDGDARRSSWTRAAR
jgi:hypothetical protein